LALEGITPTEASWRPVHYVGSSDLAPGTIPQTSSLYAPPIATHAEFCAFALGVPRMPRYFFYLKADSHLIEDEEGSELGTSQEARAQAVKSLREILATAIKSGADDSVIDAVVIADESGQELASVP